MMRCKYGDPTCPCQDGDLCHYEGEDPMNVRPDYALTAIQDAVAEAEDCQLKRCTKLLAAKNKEIQRLLVLLDQVG